MHSHQRLTKPDSSSGLVTSFPAQPPRVQAAPTAQVEITPKPDLPLQARLEQAARFGHNFGNVQVLSRSTESEQQSSVNPRQELNLSVQRQIHQVLQRQQEANQKEDEQTSQEDPSPSQASSVVLGAGGTLTAGEVFKASGLTIPAWLAPLLGYGALTVANVSIIQDKLDKGEPIPLSLIKPDIFPAGTTWEDVTLEMVSNEPIPGQSPTGERPDLIPMTGDLDTQLPPTQEKDPAQSQIYTNDPVEDIPAQIPGYPDERGQQNAEDYLLEAARLPRSDGKWSGEPGESEWISTHQDVNSVTGGKPVGFNNGYPDFSPWSRGSVTIPAMTGENEDDFPEADRLFALQQGWLKKNGEPNASASRRHRRTNRLTWHHHQDGSTMQLVPMPLHGNIPHVGGASQSRTSKSP